MSTASARFVLLSLLWCELSSGQFNARGRRPRAPQAGATSKARPPAQPASTKAPPEPAQTEVLLEQPSNATGERDVLIARYEKAIIDRPGDQVAIERLMALVRERDGNLTALAAMLETKSGAGGEPAYGATLALAEVVQVAGDRSRAERIVNDAITKWPKRPEGYLARARLARRSGALTRTLGDLERALPLQSGPPKEETLGELWQLCLELGDLECARRHHGTLVQSARGNTFIAGELGRALLARGLHREAMDELRRVARAAEGDRRALVPALRDLGRAELASGDPAAALRTLDRASRASEAEPSLRAEIDALRADAHRALGTQQDFLKELEADARTADRLALAARLYEELGQLDKAARAYRRASDLEPSDLDLRLALVRILELTLDLPGAERELAKLVRQAPGQIDLVLRYIDLLLAAGERERALVEFDRAARSFERDGSASFRLLELAERLQEAERAHRIEASLTEKAGLDRQHLVDLGSRAYRQGDGDKARAIWKRILLDRDKTRSKVVYGETLLAHDDVKGGLEVLQRAVEEAPQELEPKVALARGLLRAAALATGPTKKDYERRALAAWLLVLRDPKAERGFDQSTRSEARRQVVRLLKRTGRLTAEMATLERAFTGPKHDTEAGLTLAEAQILLRNSSEAERTLTRLHELLPGDRTVLTRLERVQLDQGKKEAALGTLERLLAIDPARAREILGRLADLAFDLHDDARAIEYAERGASLDPTDAEALSKLGTLYERSGRLGDAETAFRKALAKDAQLHAVTLKLARLLTKRDAGAEALGILLRSLRNVQRTDDVQLLGKQAVTAAVSANLERELEDQLRPLCISRPEVPALRTLLLDVISGQRQELEDRLERENSPSATRTALADLADRNLGPMLSVLAASDLEEQEQVIRLLAWGQAAGANRALLEFAEGSAPEPLRISAIEAATRHGDDAVAARLIGILRKKGPHPRGAVALSVVRGLARSPGTEARRGLLLALDAEDPSIRAEALLALSKRKPALPEATLLEIVTSDDEGEATRAAATLALTSAPTSPTVARALVPQLGRDSSLVQAGVLTALATHAPRDARFIAAASSAVFGADERLAAAAVHALVLSTGGPGANTPAPTNATLDPSGGSSSGVQEQIWSILAPPTTLRARSRLLQTDQAAFIAALEVALKTGRRPAVQALRSLSRSGGYAALAPLYTADLGTTRATSELDRDAIASAAKIHEAVLPWIALHAEGSDRELSTLALATLCPDQGSVSREALRRALHGQDDAKFEAAAFALTECESEAALPLVTELLDAKPPWPRQRRLVIVLEAWGLRQGRSVAPAIAHLLARLRTSENELVKSRATSAQVILGLTGDTAE
jgi:tetratricopeptide (TPR) repeat protein